ncbi:TPA: MFS transporter [Pseudomonas aeruginosa]|uniref:MFS transporter n=1 Tax=Pseudomonas aeruginosa TaxID=287 RepID=UPI0009A1BBC6|nr:MFS transporter [Pseudomonas aeruginosa]EKU6307687.1 MFS transporter [Pseudomonas aeruginosa]EKX2969138.1 MFS transporter [Pseudomonas aeruginosa]MDV2651949.1 MFS transporter [Pseudomonas aeruginosa]PNU09680.1 MFS transporter [Pseudomonas aeruginosa]RIZ43013.1 hypothetical protein AXX02_24520 [Pseudomonas aeruginosa]
MSSGRSIFSVLAVLLAAFLAGFQTKLFSTGLPDIRGGLGLSFDEGAWLNTAGTSGQILVAPAIAWLASVFGIRRVFIFPVLLYVVSSIVIPFLREYYFLLFFQFLHGVALGVFVPATLMVIFKNIPVSWWVFCLALYALRVPFTSNAGVYLLGVYSNTIGWEWIYWQDVFFAPLIALFACIGTNSEKVDHELLRSADWGGMILFGSGLFLIYIGLDQGNRLDWGASEIIVVCILSGFVLLFFFLMNELFVRNPWASPKILMSRNIALMLLASLAFNLSAVSSASLVPSFLTTVKLFRPEQFGETLLYYVAIPSVLLLPVVVLLLRLYDPRYLIVLGLSSFALASMLGMGVTSEWNSENFIVISFLHSVGYSFTFVSLIVFGAMNNDPKLSTSFSAYVQVNRLVGAEFGAAFMATWLRSREQTHSNLMGVYLDSSRSEVIGRVKELSSPYAFLGPSDSVLSGVKSLASIVKVQANVLSYIDGFMITMLMAFTGIALISLTKKSPVGVLSPKTKGG